MILFFEWLIYLKLMISLRNMNKNSAEILSSCAFIAFTLHEDRVKVEGQECKSNVVNDELHVVCPSSTRTVVPKDIDKNVKHLDLSGNIITLMNEESFANYQNLITLTLQNVVATTVTSPQFVFRPLENLIMLNMSLFRSTHGLNYFWPPSLKTLNLSHITTGATIGGTTLDVSLLEHLEVLDASYSELRDMPLLNERAPIKYLDLYYNPLPDLVVENLAKYCNIKLMRVFLSPGSYMSTTIKYCACLLVRKWIETYIPLTHNLTNYDFECTPLTPPPDCDLTFSDTALKNREDCLTQAGSKLFLILAIVLGLIALIGVALLVVAFKFGMLERKIHTGELVVTNDEPNTGGSNDESQTNDNQDEEILEEEDS